MKEKHVRWSRPLLTACMAFGFWVGCDIASIFFFGEHEYPTEE